MRLTRNLGGLSEKLVETNTGGGEGKKFLLKDSRVLLVRQKDLGPEEVSPG